MAADGFDETATKGYILSGWMIVIIVGIIALAAVGIIALVTRGSTDSSATATTMAPTV